MAENNQSSWKDCLIVGAALEAGKIGMNYFRKDTTDIWYKSGNSPVSQADREIDLYLKEHLSVARPDFAWLSEESEDNTARLDAQRLFVVDPIDGTRGFINGSDQWCISIAIVEDGSPVEGVLHAPALGKTIYARKGFGAYLDGREITRELSNRACPLVTGSKKLIETIENLPGKPMDAEPFIPSLAYRLGLVATGDLDGAFARGGASEWDIAAADIILRESGCNLTNQYGHEIRYNRENVTSPPLVAAPIETHDKILGLANSTGILH
ncbi:MAG: 3'(2'),5'-bisphosphate nucleotidase CysQ [Pseudomonadota bacterium]